MGVYKIKKSVSYILIWNTGFIFRLLKQSEVKSGKIAPPFSFFFHQNDAFVIEIFKVLILLNLREQKKDNTHKRQEVISASCPSWLSDVYYIRVHDDTLTPRSVERGDTFHSPQ